MKRSLLSPRNLTIATVLFVGAVTLGSQFIVRAISRSLAQGSGMMASSGTDANTMCVAPAQDKNSVIFVGCGGFF